MVVEKLQIQKGFGSTGVLIQLTSLCRWNYNRVCHIGYDQFCNGPNASKPIIITLKLQLKLSLFHKVWFDYFTQSFKFQVDLAI